MISSLRWPIVFHKCEDEMEKSNNLYFITARKKSCLDLVGTVRLKCIISIMASTIMTSNLACYYNYWSLHYYPSFSFNPFFSGSLVSQTDCYLHRFFYLGHYIHNPSLLNQDMFHSLFCVILDQRGLGSVTPSKVWNKKWNHQVQI